MDLNNQYEDHEEDADDDTDEHAGTAHPRSFHAIAGWLYDKAISGIAGIELAETLAERYLADAGGDVALAARNLIHWESIKAGSSGFLSGIGG